MKRSIKALTVIITFAGSALVIGCKDDSSGGSDAGPAAHDAGPGSSDAGPGAHDAGPPTDAGPPSDGGPRAQCTNAHDGPILQMEFDGGTPDGGGVGGDPSAIAGMCALRCFGIGGMAEYNCNATCLMGATGLSEGCTSCYVDAINCAIENCADSCLADSSSPACTTCRCGSNEGSVDCFRRYDTCTGLTIHSAVCGTP